MLRKRTNDVRVARFQAALDQFDGGEGEPLREVLVDLLADAIHWCEAKNIDFENSLSVARRHHRDELTERGDATGCTG